MCLEVEEGGEVVLAARLAPELGPGRGLRPEADVAHVGPEVKEDVVAQVASQYLGFMVL